MVYLHQGPIHPQVLIKCNHNITWTTRTGCQTMGILLNKCKPGVQIICPCRFLDKCLIISIKTRHNNIWEDLLQDNQDNQVWWIHKILIIQTWEDLQVLSISTCHQEWTCRLVDPWVLIQILYIEITNKINKISIFMDKFRKTHQLFRKLCIKILKDVVDHHLNTVWLLNIKTQITVSASKHNHLLWPNQVFNQLLRSKERDYQWLRKIMKIKMSKTQITDQLLDRLKEDLQELNTPKIHKLSSKDPNTITLEQTNLEIINQTMLIKNLNFNAQFYRI